MPHKKRYGNFWVHRAASATRMGHQSAPPLRYTLIGLLIIAWLGCGWLGWQQAGRSPLDAAYTTFTMLGASKDYISIDGWALQIARFSGLALPFVGVFFVFYGLVSRTLARIYLRFATGHVIIAGASPAALHLAQDCAKNGHGVVLIQHKLAKETLSGLAKQKIIVLEGDASLTATLRLARGAHGAHACAMMDDEAENLRIEAAFQYLAATERRAKHPLILHLLLPSIVLRREARDLRNAVENERKAKLAKGKSDSTPMRVDTRPFSLAEIGVRQAMISFAPTLLDRCIAEGQPRPHLLLVGFDDANEAMAAWALTRMWSARFEPPRITVLSPSAPHSQGRFDAHFPEARAHGVWQADIAFETLLDHGPGLSEAAISQIEAASGPITAICVSVGDDSNTIGAALALMRVFEGETARPMPIMMRESTASEFSKRYGHQESIPTNSPFLVAFGQVQKVALSSVLLEGELDRAAALCHLAYEAFNEEERGPVPQRKMDQAARGGWTQLGETYRHANRASADHAAIKVWDAELRPAASGEHGERNAEFDPDIAERLAMTEHARWNAERLLDGWKPGKTRVNRARIHDKLVPWDRLDERDKDKDRVMVRVAAKATRWIYPNGLVHRPTRPGTHSNA